MLWISGKKRVTAAHANKVILPLKTEFKLILCQRKITSYLTIRGTSLRAMVMSVESSEHQISPHAE